MRRQAISSLSTGDNNGPQGLLSPRTALLLPKTVPRRDKIHLAPRKTTNRLSL